MEAGPGRLGGVLEAGLGVLEARLGVLEAGPGVLEARLSVLEAGLGVLEVGLRILEARLGVVGRPGSTSWCIPMRFYKVFDAKTGPMGLKAKKHYFSNRISINFVFPGHTELLPGHIELLPGHTKLLPGRLGGRTGRLGGRTGRS